MLDVLTDLVSSKFTNGFNLKFEFLIKGKKKKKKASCQMGMGFKLLGKVTFN